MATILEQRDVSDGHDILVELADSRRTVFHFPSVPADAQASVDALEAALPAEETYVIEGES